MFNRRDVVVRPLHEELAEIGIDPAKIIGEVQANSGLPVRAELTEAKRVLRSGPLGRWGRSDAREHLKKMGFSGSDSDGYLDDWESGKGVVNITRDHGSKLADRAAQILMNVQVGEELSDLLVDKVEHGTGSRKEKIRALQKARAIILRTNFGPGQLHRAWVSSFNEVAVPLGVKPMKEDIEADAEELDEQMQVVKVKKLRGAQLAQARKQRKKLRSVKKAYAKKYYARSKRKIAKRRGKALKKYGAKGLEKLHRQHKKVMVAGLDRLATLREDLEESQASALMTGKAQEVALNGGWLAVLLGEIFESVGEQDSADTLFELSDNAADLADRLAGVTEESLSGRNQEELEHLVLTVAKALEVHEDLGSPSLWEAINYGLEQGLVEDEELDEGSSLERQIQDFAKGIKDAVAKATGDKRASFYVMDRGKFTVSAKVKDEKVLEKLWRVFPKGSWVINFDEGRKMVFVSPKPKFLQALVKTMSEGDESINYGLDEGYYPREGTADVHLFVPSSDIGALYSVGDYIGSKRINKHIRTIIHGIENKRSISTEAVAAVLSAMPKNKQLKDLRNALKNTLNSAD